MLILLFATYWAAIKDLRASRPSMILTDIRELSTKLDQTEVNAGGVPPRIATIRRKSGRDWTTSNDTFIECTEMRTSTSSFEGD
jgi:hypothetical protein